MKIEYPQTPCSIWSRRLRRERWRLFHMEKRRERSEAEMGGAKRSKGRALRVYSAVEAYDRYRKSLIK